jgi:hypothetical protein
MISSLMTMIGIFRDDELKFLSLFSDKEINLYPVFIAGKMMPELTGKTKEYI